MISENCKLILGDCLEEMKKLSDGLVDLTITSPPYDSIRMYGGYSFDFEKIANELLRITKNNGVVIWIVNDSTLDGSETGTSFKQALFFKEIGFDLHDTMIWYRRTLPQNTNRYEPAFEYMFVFSKGKPNSFNPIKSRRLYDDRRKNKNFHRDEKGDFTKNEFEQRNEVTIGNVWDIPNRGHDKEAYAHPAIFPKKLVEGHIETWSNKNDLIFDPFMGSGTTGVVALKLQRKFIGMEINPEYFKIAENRIGEWKNQTRLIE